MREHIIDEVLINIIEYYDFYKKDDNYFITVHERVIPIKYDDPDFQSICEYNTDDAIPLNTGELLSVAFELIKILDER